MTTIDAIPDSAHRDIDIRLNEGGTPQHVTDHMLFHQPVQEQAFQLGSLGHSSDLSTKHFQNRDILDFS